MAQMTGTQILAFARVLAQDTSTAQPAVSDANALLLLNDVTLRFTGDVQGKQSLIWAAQSGLTFPANTGMKLTTATDDQWDHILAAFQDDSSTSGNVVQSPPLEHWTVEQMLDVYQNSSGGALTGSGQGARWVAYAWERQFEATMDTASPAIRVYAWPPLTAQAYMTIRVPKNMILSALTATPDLSHREARIVARLLAWEMARLHSRDEAFLQQILAPIPTRVLDAYFEAAKSHGWMQSGVRDTGALDG